MKESDVQAAMDAVLCNFDDRDRRYLDELTSANKQITALESTNRAQMGAILRKNEMIANQEVVIKALTDVVADLKVQLAAFTGSDPTPADLPEPPRRADGTLAPTKPLTLPKQDGDRRMVGS